MTILKFIFLYKTAIIKIQELTNHQFKNFYKMYKNFGNKDDLSWEVLTAII